MGKTHHDLEALQRTFFEDRAVNEEESVRAGPGFTSRLFPWDSLLNGCIKSVGDFSVSLALGMISRVAQRRNISGAIPHCLRPALEQLLWCESLPSPSSKTQERNIRLELRQKSYDSRLIL
jgi:hypothetical protein